MGEAPFHEGRHPRQVGRRPIQWRGRPDATSRSAFQVDARARTACTGTEHRSRGHGSLGVLGHFKLRIDSAYLSHSSTIRSSSFSVPCRLTSRPHLSLAVTKVDEGGRLLDSEEPVWRSRPLRKSDEHLVITQRSPQRLHDRQLAITERFALPHGRSIGPQRGPRRRRASGFPSGPAT